MSMRKAINDKCRDCNYDQLDKGTWRQQVEACRCTDCPLYPYRPVSKASKSTEIDAISDLTEED